MSITYDEIPSYVYLKVREFQHNFLQKTTNAGISSYVMDIQQFKYHKLQNSRFNIHGSGSQVSTFFGLVRLIMFCDITLYNSKLY